MAKKIKLVLTENQIDVLTQALEWAIGTVDDSFKEDSPDLYKDAQKMRQLDASILKTIQKHYAKVGA